MLYRFDKKLRLLLFNEIEKIEIAVRCAVVISKNILSTASKKCIAINFCPQENSLAPKLGQNHMGLQSVSPLRKSLPLKCYSEVTAGKLNYQTIACDIRKNSFTLRHYMDCMIFNS